jgi:RecJ-like exonuclease
MLIKCPDCNGDGREESHNWSHLTECSNCLGKGEIDTNEPEEDMYGNKIVSEIEKGAFKAASTAQARGATATECLEIGIRHAMKSTEDALRDEVEYRKDKLEDEYRLKSETLRMRYAIIEKQSEHLRKLVCDYASFFEHPRIKVDTRNLTEHQKAVEEAAGMPLDWNMAAGYEAGKK